MFKCIIPSSEKSNVSFEIIYFWKLSLIFFNELNSLSRVLSFWRLVDTCTYIFFLNFRAIKSNSKLFTSKVTECANYNSLNYTIKEIFIIGKDTEILRRSQDIRRGGWMLQSRKWYSSRLHRIPSVDRSRPHHHNVLLEPQKRPFTGGGLHGERLWER